MSTNTAAHIDGRRHGRMDALLHPQCFRPSFGASNGSRMAIEIWHDEDEDNEPEYGTLDLEPMEDQ